MSNRYATVIILAEDARSANLLRRYCQRALGVTNHRIRQEISTRARGDAKQWVVQQYPVEVKELRRQLSHVCLLVHLDADVESTARRAQDLANALQADQQRAREPQEPVSHVIPRRHTETWLSILTGVEVDEEQDCKRQGQPRNPDGCLAQAAERLYGFTRQNAAAPLLPSLNAAVDELRRLEQ